MTGSERGQTMTQVGTAGTAPGDMGTAGAAPGDMDTAGTAQADVGLPDAGHGENGPGRTGARTGPWKRGRVLAAAALLLGLFLLLHASIPNRVGNL
ncbi:hypothetical protein G3M58_11720, partial [Streptomyces sp. SID7499]|nr:hypothetical protein [Streptomyces sp. SID7499]